MATLETLATAVGTKLDDAAAPVVPLVEETANPTAGTPFCEYE